MSINAVYQYRRKWRFLFNAGKDKTEIMVFHAEDMERKMKEKELEGGWKLGEKER